MVVPVTRRMNAVPSCVCSMFPYFPTAHAPPGNTAAPFSRLDAGSARLLSVFQPSRRSTARPEVSSDARSCITDGHGAAGRPRRDAFKTPGTGAMSIAERGLVVITTQLGSDAGPGCRFPLVRAAGVLGYAKRVQA